MTLTGQHDPTTGLPTNAGIDPLDRVSHRIDFGQAIAKSSSFKGTSTHNVAMSWNQYFIRSGEGAMTALARSGGGTRLLAESSDSASGCLIKPRTGGVLATTKFDSAQEPWFEVLLRTGSDVSTIAIQAGLMLTGVMNRTTDANQVKFWFNADYTTWQLATSIAGTDAVLDTGVTPVASTLYQLAFKVRSDRFVECFVNGVHKGNSASAITTAINLIPIVGVASDGASADPTLDLFHMTLSHNAYA